MSEQVNPQDGKPTESLADLTVTEEQAGSTRGGAQRSDDPIIVGAGPGSGGHVKVFDGRSGTLL